MTHYRLNEPTVIEEIIDGEAIIANLGVGLYYSLDALGTGIWNALMRGAQVSAITEALTQRYPDEHAAVARGVEDLVERFVAEALIVPSGNGAAEPLDLQVALGEKKTPAFEPPTLHKHSDMQQMLLLDPIHDVDETGWPNAAGGETS